MSICESYEGCPRRQEGAKALWLRADDSDADGVRFHASRCAGIEVVGDQSVLPERLPWVQFALVGPSPDEDVRWKSC